MIIVDGASTDHTALTAEKYIKIAAQKSLQIFYKSEPDTGIYNAMNKGVERADETRCIFMNAGDEFYDENSLRCFDRAGNECEIAYGDKVDVYDGKVSIASPLPRKLFCRY